MLIRSILACVISTALLAGGSAARAMYAPGSAPFVNTWLVAGPFANDRDNTGFERDWIGETGVHPEEGRKAGDCAWSYFDDRLFSRNYDDYQDLYSYFEIKLGAVSGGKTVYAHTYLFAPTAIDAQLRVGANSEFKAWVNGIAVGAGSSPAAGKDDTILPIRLRRGWNGLLLKVANRSESFLGFYARITDRSAGAIPALVASADGGDGTLAVSSRSMPAAGAASLPDGYRGWPYVEFNVPYIDYLKTRSPEKRERIECFTQASSFQLEARGGMPPYRWSVASGVLPAGLSMEGDGRFHGRIASGVRLGNYTIPVKVTDSSGRSANKNLSMTVRERPTRWYEQAGLVGLVHAPETLQPQDFDGFANLMKQQGYRAAMVISYGNGDFRFRYPSRYEPNNADGDLIGAYKAAFDRAGVLFGMYFGNIENCPQFAYDQVGSMLADAVRRYHPAALYFDWCDKHVRSDDAIYSAVRSASPNCVIVLNGMRRPENGDWDVLCIESMAYGRRSLLWDSWPGEFYENEMPMVSDWPKKPVLESWRLFVPTAGADDRPDWREALRLMISLIGDGCTANIDHSPTWTGKTPAKRDALQDSPALAAHEKMAEWANPPGVPPLTPSYTNIVPGPIASPAWGYDLANASRTAVYLHFVKNPRGKSGLPSAATVTVGPIAAKIKSATWMNRDRPVRFEQAGASATLILRGIDADPVDTIVRLDLATPLPDAMRDPPYPAAATPPIRDEDLAFHKPAKLLSLDGSHELQPCAGKFFASNAVDGDTLTVAQAGGEWPWTLEVDLEKMQTISRIKIVFDRNYATEFSVAVSADGRAWTTVRHVENADGAAQAFRFAPAQARYVRVLGIKPNGPNQPGGQMGICELEVYR